MLDEEPSKKGTSIIDMVPPELFYQFLEQMDLPTMGNKVSTNAKMVRGYLETFRRR